MRSRTAGSWWIVGVVVLMAGLALPPRGALADGWPALGPEVAVELDPATETVVPTYARAAENQATPDVAAATSVGQSLAVWVDTRNSTGVPMIYATRIRADGVVLDAGNIPVRVPTTRVDALGNYVTGLVGQPRVASTGTDYLVVWSEIPDPNSPQLSNLYGARVRSADGVVLDPTPIAICTAVNRQEGPALASNGTNGEYFVVWHDYRNAATNGWDLWGARIRASDGALLEERLVSDALSHQFWPAVAYSAARQTYLVVWDDRRDAGQSGNIYGSLWQGVGPLVRVTAGADIAIRQETAGLFYPSVAASGEYFAVTWNLYYDMTGTSDYPIARAVSASTGALGQWWYYPGGGTWRGCGASQCILCETHAWPNRPRYLRLVALGDHWVLLWRARSEGLTPPGLCRVDTRRWVFNDWRLARLELGQTLPTDPTAIGGNPLEYRACSATNPCPSGQTCSNAACVRSCAASIDCLPGQWCSGSLCAERGGQFALATQPDGTGLILATRADAAGRSGYDLNLHRFAETSGGFAFPDAAVNGLLVSRSANREAWPAVARSGSRLLAAWRDDRSQVSAGAGWDVRGLRLDAESGQLIEPLGGIAIAGGAGTQQMPAAVGHPDDRFLVAWVDGVSTAFNLVDANNGTLMLAPSPLAFPWTATAWPALTTNGDNFLLALQYTPSGGTPSIRAVRIDRNGTVLDAGGLDLGPGETPAVASDGHDFVVAWTLHDEATGAYAVRAARIHGSPADGGRIDATPVEIAGTVDTALSRAAVAYGPEGYLVLWLDQRNLARTGEDLWASRFTAAGELVDPGGFAVIADPGHQRYPQLLASGDRFLVSWSEYDADVAWPFRVRGAELDATGAVSGESRFTLTDDGWPAAVSRMTETGDGRVLAVYHKLGSAPVPDVFRIVARFIDVSVACETSFECPAGRVCRDGLCIPGCDSDADCPTGRICVDDQCVAQQCAGDDDCPLAELCVTGRCTVGCNDDARCPEGQVCFANRCLEPECRADADCPAGHTICVDYRCVVGCRDDAGCTEPETICENLACVSGCRADEGCLAAGFICLADRCVAGCRDDAGCTEPETICENLACVAGCRGDEGCLAAGFICVADRCVAGCRDDAGCTEPETICENLVCMAGCRDDAGCTEPETICENLVCVTGCRDDAGCTEPETICEEFVCVRGCRDDAGCPAAYLCVDGLCRAGCRDDADCPAGYLCVGAVCAPGCLTDADCPAGYRCAGAVCAPGCLTDADCPAWLLCVDGLCQAGCRADADCPAGHRCVENACVPGCTTDADCGPERLCQGDVCTPGCRADTGCLPGRVCEAGFCGPPACAQHADCGPERLCVAGQCVPGCVADTDCVGERFCLAGQCADPECVTDGDCAPGSHCVVPNCVLGCLEDAHCDTGERCAGGACVAVECGDSDDCPLGSLCEAGQCVPGCATDRDCPAAFVCAAGRCEPVSGTCADDADCPQGWHCADAVCWPNGRLCEVDADCGPHGFCDADGRCRMNPHACDGDHPCVAGLLCVDFRCSDPAGGIPCDPSAGCPPGSVCQGGLCQVPAGGACRSDAACVPPLVCDSNGVCRQAPGTTCFADTDCAAGLRCVGDVCRGDAGSACTDDDDCHGQRVCDGGSCRQPAGARCLTFADCAAPARCLGGVCVPIEAGGACPGGDDRECLPAERCVAGLCTPNENPEPPASDVAVPDAGARPDGGATADTGSAPGTDGGGTRADTGGGGSGDRDEGGGGRRGCAAGGPGGAETLFGLAVLVAVALALRRRRVGASRG